jgi:hypothetical protein
MRVLLGLSHTKGRIQIVCEKWVLRSIFGPKREDVTGGWRRLHNEELHNFYASPNITAIKSRRMSWAEHVACMGEARNAYNILVGNLKDRGHLEDLNVDRRIILEWILETQDGKLWTGFIWVRIETSSGLFVNTIMNLRVQGGNFLLPE